MKRITHSIMFSVAAGSFLLCSGIAEAQDAADRGSPVTRGIAVPSAATEVANLDLGGDWALRIEGFSDEQWAVFEILMSLSSAEWQMLQSVLMLDAEQLTLLEQLLQQDGEAFVSADGCAHASAGGPEEYAPDGSAIRVAAGGINTVINKVDNALSKINGVRNVVDNIKAAVGPNRPDVKDLLEKIELGRLGQILDVVREQVGGIIAVVQELKAGFDDFAPSGSCGAPCVAFKNQLGNLFHDLQDVWIVLQALRCIEDPNARLTPLNTDLFETLLIDKAPTVVLYVLYRFLEQFPEWDTLVRGGIEHIPTTLILFCEGEDNNPLDFLHQPLGEPSDPTSCVNSPNKKCCALRPAAIETALKVTKVAAQKAPRVFALVESWMSDDKELTAAAVAVGGGGGGTNIKNPPSGMAKTLKIISEKVLPLIDRLLSDRDACLATDQRMEIDLLHCNAMVQYVLTSAHDGKFEEVADLVLRRIEQMEAADQADEQTVEDLQSAIAAEDYNELCLAYQALTGP